MGNENSPHPLNVQRLWEKYEDIAMHFNELLMQLRMRSLAGIAAASTLVGVLTNGSTSSWYGNFSFDWIVSAGLLGALGVIWVAIFCLDVFYYNRLLSGAAFALTELEKKICANKPVDDIDLSTLIVKEFADSRVGAVPFGVAAFYLIVLALISLGAVFSVRMAFLA